MFGFFKKIGELVANPVRGLGRIARGKFKEGLGDIAGTARYVAPFTGVGLLPSIAIGAVDDLTHDRGVGKTLMNAGMTAATAKLLAGGGGGGGGDAPVPAEKIATPSLGKTPNPAALVANGNGSALGEFAKTLPNVKPNNPWNAIRGATNGAAAVRDVAPNIAAIGIPDVNLGSTPNIAGLSSAPQAGMSGYEKGKLALDAAGLLAGAYGAYQGGKVEDRRFDLYEQDRERQIMLDEERRAAMRAAAQRMASQWRSY